MSTYNTLKNIHTYPINLSEQTTPLTHTEKHPLAISIHKLIIFIPSSLYEIYHNLGGLIELALQLAREGGVHLDIQ